MRKVVIFGLLGMLLITLGCPQIQKAQAKSETSTTCNFVGGSGLVITADIPYSEVYAGDTIDFTVHIENNGDADAIIKKICIFGIDPNLIQDVTLDGESIEEKPCANIENKELEKAQKIGTSIIPGGMADIDVTLSTPRDLKSELEQPVSIYVIYNYSTYVTGSLCIQNPYTKVSNPVCKAGEIKDLCQSGGPIKLNNIKAYVRKNGNNAYVILTMTFMNMGNGKLYTESNEYKATVSVKVKLSNTEMTCGKSNKVKIPSTGEFTIRCTGNIPINNQEAFNYGYYLPFEVELNYTYETTWSYTFTVLPQLE